MPLTTRCGRCGRLFPVFAQELRDRRGRVHCPQCGNRFDAIGALIDEPRVGSESSSARARLGAPRRKSTPDQSPLAVPSPRAARHRGTLGWGLASLLLALALVAQLGWWQRETLLAEPAARAWMQHACEALGCTLPDPPRIAGSLELMEPRLIPSADDGAGGLGLRLKVRNTAALPQPPPDLDLELFDPGGELFAARRFGPADYAWEDGRLIAPGEEIGLALDLAAPGIEASGFKVRLL
jgi:hypothetical protein